jgi:hypothetical protein
LRFRRAKTEGPQQEMGEGAHALTIVPRSCAVSSTEMLTARDVRDRKTK